MRLLIDPNLLAASIHIQCAHYNCRWLSLCLLCSELSLCKLEFSLSLLKFCLVFQRANQFDCALELEIFLNRCAATFKMKCVRSRLSNFSLPKCNHGQFETDTYLSFALNSAQVFIFLSSREFLQSRIVRVWFTEFWLSRPLSTSIETFYMQKNLLLVMTNAYGPLVWDPLNEPI